MMGLQLQLALPSQQEVTDSLSMQEPKREDPYQLKKEFSQATLIRYATTEYTTAEPIRAMQNDDQYKIAAQEHLTDKQQALLSKKEGKKPVEYNRQISSCKYNGFHTTVAHQSVRR